MGYPMGMFESSLLIPEENDDITEKEISPKFKNFEISRNPLPGFGIFRDMNIRTQSDIIKQQKLLNSLIQAHKDTAKSAIPKIITSNYEAYEDGEVQISVSKFESVNVENRGFFSCLRDYSVDEEVNEDEVERLMKDFQRL